MFNGKRFVLRARGLRHAPRRASTPGSLIARIDHGRHNGANDGLSAYLPAAKFSALEPRFPLFGCDLPHDSIAFLAAIAFKHTFGTLAVEDNMPIVVAKDILGHASASTTSIYIKVKDERIAEAAEQYYAKNGGNRGSSRGKK
ncbi:hypothetical protein [Massilia haematophila]|uniref:Tyr recombinase domain-containing protein n=1 Tax=Massilia haematophila TaxID=457923 RepID=A0ABV7PQK8_9BURK